jgi:IS4 transposase
MKKSEVNSKEMKELYTKRWRIETSYDRLKNKLHIENFSGREKITVLQDFNVIIVAFNFLISIKHKTNLNIPKEKKNGRISCQHKHISRKNEKKNNKNIIN